MLEKLGEFGEKKTVVVVVAAVGEERDSVLEINSMRIGRWFLNDLRKKN